MKKYAIDLDLSRCVACGACAVACMDQNDFEGTKDQKPFRSIYDLETEQNGEMICQRFTLSCLHCDDAPCITACPKNCLQKDPKTGFTVYDTTDCIGCRKCFRACPYKIPSFGEDRKMRKCDGCYVRVHYGLLPACVKACPFGALKLVDTEVPEEKQPIPKAHSLRENAAVIVRKM